MDRSITSHIVIYMKLRQFIHLAIQLEGTQIIAWWEVTIIQQALTMSHQDLFVIWMWLSLHMLKKIVILSLSYLKRI